MENIHLEVNMYYLSVKKLDSKKKTAPTPNKSCVFVLMKCNLDIAFEHQWSIFNKSSQTKLSKKTKFLLIF